MNKSCLKCGRIITVPDIPLPAGYTQKCTACGYDNPVGEEEGGAPGEMVSPLPPPPAASPTPVSAAAGIERPRQARGVGQSARPVKSRDPNGGASRPVVDLAVLEKIKAELRRETDRRLHDLEQQIQALTMMNQSVPPGFMDSSMKGPEDPFEKRLRELVAYRQVLLCTQNASLIRATEDALKGSGWELTPSSSAAHLVQTMEEKHFQVIIIDQRMTKTPEDSKALIQQISASPLPVRRCQIAVLITPNLNTGESQVFYQWGFDLNIHLRDYERLAEVLDDLFILKRELLADVPL